MNRFIAKHLKLVFLLSVLVPIVLVVFGIALFSSSREKRLQELNAKFSGWVAKTGTITPFQANFPGQPQVKSDTLTVGDGATAKQEVLSFQADTQDAYIVQAIVYSKEVEPKGRDTQAEYLQALLDDTVKRIKGEMISRRIGDVYGQNREASFVIYQPVEKRYYKGKLFVRGNTLYQVWTVTLSKDYTDQDTYFVDSFKVAE